MDDKAYRVLMALGRQVIDAERVFGVDSEQYARAVSLWRAQQRKMG